MIGKCVMHNADVSFFMILYRISRSHREISEFRVPLGGIPASLFESWTALADNARELPIDLRGRLPATCEFSTTVPTNHDVFPMRFLRSFACSFVRSFVREQRCSPAAAGQFHEHRGSFFGRTRPGYPSGNADRRRERLRADATW